MRKTSNGFLYVNIEKEIDETSDILDHIGQGIVLGDTMDLTDDVKIMKFKVKVLEDAIGMVQKASLHIEGLDNFQTMNPRQRRMFVKIVKFVSFFRRK